MLHFGSIHIHNMPSCRDIAGLQVKKHDGVLGEPFALHAHYDSVPAVVADLDIPGIRVSGTCGYIPLTPQQALSLRDWLIQESSVLEQMATVQDE